MLSYFARIFAMSSVLLRNSFTFVFGFVRCCLAIVVVVEIGRVRLVSLKLFLLLTGWLLLLIVRDILGNFRGLVAGFGRVGPGK